MGWIIIGLFSFSMFVLFCAQDARAKKGIEWAANIVISGFLFLLLSFVFWVVCHWFFYGPVDSPERLDVVGSVTYNVDVGWDGGYNFVERVKPGEIQEEYTVGKGDSEFRYMPKGAENYVERTEYALDAWTFPFDWMRSDQAQYDFYGYDRPDTPS